jgi:hypothetical protein
MTDYDLKLTKTTTAMYISRALAVLAAVFAFTTTIAALPTPGENAPAQDLCVLRRGEEGTAETAC